MPLLFYYFRGSLQMGNGRLSLPQATAAVHLCKCFRGNYDAKRVDFSYFQIRIFNRWGLSSNNVIMIFKKWKKKKTKKSVATWVYGSVLRPDEYPQGYQWSQGYSCKIIRAINNMCSPMVILRAFSEDPRICLSNFPCYPWKTTDTHVDIYAKIGTRTAQIGRYTQPEHRSAQAMNYGKVYAKTWLGVIHLRSAYVR